MKNYLFFDTETTGLPKDHRAPVSDLANWPRIVQLAWLFADDDGDILAKGNHIIKPQGFQIPENMVHGITTRQAIREGVPIADALTDFHADLMDADAIVCHNYAFDAPIVGAEMLRARGRNPIPKFPAYCTMRQTAEWAGVRKDRVSLSELHQLCMGEGFPNAHDAMADVMATARCFFHIKRHSPGVFAFPYH